MTDRYMAMAIKEAEKGIHAGDGGPFGCVIVKNGKVVGSGHNCVVVKHDATCHGEMEAIRSASQALGTHDLSGCVLYTTGEPCNMCLCACLWANIQKIYYGATINDNAKIGFRDAKFNRIFGGRYKLTKYLCQMDRQDCLELFQEYIRLQHELY